MALSDSLAVKWPSLSPLLDEALDLPDADRSAWLKNLPTEQRGLRTALYRLLNNGQGVIEPPEANTTCQAGAWRLVSKIGEGGMAEVWLAERQDGLLGRPVAIKLPKVGYGNTLFCQRLERERQILGCLNHPNIARLLDAGTTLEGQPFLALEFVDGEPIVGYCQRRQLSVRERLGLFLQVAGAISFAHRSLVLHRDLKPSNILVTPDGNVHVLDFGIAALLERGYTQNSELTMLEGRALTLHYASPEQIAGEPLTVASDVYSLGVVLYELLAGIRPRTASSSLPPNLGELAESPLPSVTVTDKQLSRTLKGDLDTILSTALRNSAEARYQSVDAFKEDLERYLNRRPILARRSSWYYRLWMCARRHRTAFVASAVVICALLASVAVIIWQAHLAQREKRIAEEAKAIVISMLFDAHSYWGNGKPLSALDVLKRTQQRLMKLPASDVRTRVQVLNILGVSLLSQQDTLGAEAVINNAMGSAAVLAANDTDRLRSRLYKLWVELYRGEISSIRDKVDQLIDDMKRFGSAFPEDQSGALRIRCMIAIEENDSEKAIASAQAALQIAESRLGLRHNQSVLGLVDLTYAFLSAGKNELALQTARRAVARGLEAYAHTATHPNVIKARIALAQAMAASGDTQAAVLLAKQAISDIALLFGPSSLLEGLSLRKLALIDLQAGRPREATESIRRSCQTLAQHYRVDSPAYQSLLKLRTAIESTQGKSPQLAATPPGALQRRLSGRH